MRTFVFAVSMSVGAVAAAQQKPDPPVAATHKKPVELVEFPSEESMARLSRSRHKVDFFFLANQFESQENRADCGPTSAVIVLNALRANDERVGKPRDESAFPAEFAKALPPGIDPVFRRYTQRTFLDERTDKVKPRAQFYGRPASPGARPDGGLQLRQLDGMLRAYGLATTLRVAEPSLTDEAMRRELVANLGRAGDFVIVNYFRPALGQRGGGHLSPLGAYDEASDSFLILDVNPNGQRWVWVPAADLFRAMRTRDVVEPRGYVLVSEGSTKPPK